MGSGIIFVVNLRISHNLPIYGIHVYNNNYIYINSFNKYKYLF